MSQPDLSELAHEYVLGRPVVTSMSGVDVERRRAFLAGAEAALRIAKQPDGVRNLTQQIVAIGRTVGTAVEQA